MTSEQIDTMEVAELVAWAAGLEKECSCDGDCSWCYDPPHDTPPHSHLCAGDCKGSGTVPRFEKLRQECWCDCHHAVINDDSLCFLKCALCSGTFYTLIPTSEWFKLGVDIALAQGWHVCLGEGVSVFHWVHDGLNEISEDGLTPLTNLWRALAKALISEE